jgi:hypothetical protein
MRLARAHDRLINEVRDRGLGHRIAYVEIHNEMNLEVGGDGDERRLNAEAAIAFLRHRHPDLMITADYAWLDRACWAKNSQLVDLHGYSKSGLTRDIYDLPRWDPDKGPDLTNERLRWFLKPEVIPWKTFVAQVDREAFKMDPSLFCLTWFYANIDNNRYDLWCFQHFGQQAEAVRDNIASKISEGAAWGREFGVPVVIDEGYNVYPPLGSRFEESAAGRWITENAVHKAIEEGYWGILPTGYFAPDEPGWHEEPQKSYMTELNEHILKGKVDRLVGR